MPSFNPIRTSVFQPGKSLVKFILENLPADQVQDSMILAITSKIVSLSEDRLVKKESISKADLIQTEADRNFGQIGHGCYLTIKHGLFIASAGIDESNSEAGEYILYPKDPFISARNIWVELRKQWGIENLGILITDSHTSPLRKGVTGISLSYWGFHGVKSMVGTSDLFGRKLQMTNINVADALAAGVTLFMGEANECQPLAIILNSGVTFVEEIDPKELQIPFEQDLYLPFLLKDSI